MTTTTHGSWTSQHSSHDHHNIWIMTSTLGPWPSQHLVHDINNTCLMTITTLNTWATKHSYHDHLAHDHQKTCLMTITTSDMWETRHISWPQEHSLPLQHLTHDHHNARLKTPCCRRIENSVFLYASVSNSVILFPNVKFKERNKQQLSVCWEHLK